MKTLEHQFNNIYNANYGKVFRLCMGYFNGNEVMAKDITQEVFVKVWQNMESFRNQSKVSTWVYRITVNTCLSQIRSVKKERTVDAFPRDVSSPETVSSVDYETQLRDLYNCINKLNKTNKAIILLELEDVPQKEIASVMGISHQALRTRINRIKSSLTKCVKENGL